MMIWLRAAVLVAALVACLPAQAEDGRLAWLQRQNPFAILTELHAFTYAELREIYPGLDERMMQVLMIRIVESMKGR